MLAVKTGYVLDRFDIWLLRLNDQFDTLWTRTLTQRPVKINEIAEPFGFTAVADSGYILSGQKLVGTSLRAIVYRLDTSGVITWSQGYGGSPNGNNRFWWPIALGDGGFLLAGEYVDSINYTSNVYLVRTDAFGQQAIQTTIAEGPELVADLYPNPVRGELHWNMSGKKNITLTLELISMEGKVVLHKDHLPLSGSLAILGVATGLYQCRITCGDRFLMRKLVVE